MDRRIVSVVLALVVGGAGAGCAATKPLGGPDVDERLIVAAATGDQVGIAAALAEGADVDLADGDGVRPLAHARARGQGEIASLLEVAGARP